MGRIDEALRRSNLDAGQVHGSRSRPRPPRRRGDSSSRKTGTVPPPEKSPASSPPPRRPGPKRCRRETASRRAGAGSTRASLSGSSCRRTLWPLLVEQFRTLAGTLHRAQLEKHCQERDRDVGFARRRQELRGRESGPDAERVVQAAGAAGRCRSAPAVSAPAFFSVRNSRGLSEALAATSDEKLTTVQISDDADAGPCRPARRPTRSAGSRRAA